MKYRNRFNEEEMYEVENIEYKIPCSRKYTLVSTKQSLVCEWNEISVDAHIGDILIVLNGELVKV